MLSFAATALIAASGASALVKPSFNDIAGGIDHVNDNTNGPQVISGSNDGQSTSLFAGTECSSEAWAASYRQSESAYVYAVKNAIKNTCYYGYDQTYWQKSYDFMIDWARAYAHAYASAEAECKSYSNAGKTSGCAYAAADASAISSALASAHARASAEAFADYCSCSNAEAWAFGDASIVVKLIAKAWAEASAVACSKNNQISKASAYANCYASVVAEVWAFAMAEAAAQAQCWPGNDAKASADILAKVGVYITYEERCIIDVSESGLADAGVGNSGTFTGFVRLPATPADPLLHPGGANP